MTTPASVTREQLYELVWREPMLKVAQGFGVSSSYLARVCTELRVPRPERGYWAKLEFGKNPARPPLPAPQLSDITEWKPGAAIGTAQRTAVQKRKKSALQTSTTTPVERRHDLLVGARPLFLKTRATDNELLRPYKRCLVDIVVSEKHLDDALNAANALFNALEGRKHQVALGASNAHARRAEVDVREVPIKNRYYRQVWSPDRVTIVRIGRLELGLTLFEMTENVEMMRVGSDKYVPVRDLTSEQLRRFKEPHYWRTHDDIASGRLALQAYSANWRVPWVQVWRESKAGQFAAMMPSIVKALEAAVPDLERKGAEAEVRAAEEERKRDEEWRRAREKAEKARQEKARQDSRNDLLSAIAAWEQTRSIHAYFQAVEQQLEQLVTHEAIELRERLEKARALVGEPDALAHLLNWRAPQER